MRRWWMLLLTAALLTGGCMSNGQSQNIPADTGRLLEEHEAESDGEEAVPEVPLANDRSLVVSRPWADLESAVGKARPALSIPQYEARVQPYRVQPRLANVTNASRFSGFTADQLKMLTENGFVVVPSRDTKMHYVYDNNEYAGVPNFITADSVLHTYHHFYDKSLMLVESSHLYDDLDRLTSQMLEDAVELHGKLQEEDLRELQRGNAVSLLVARRLMNPEAAVPSELDAKAAAIANQELALIDAASSFERSPLFGIDLDYSQFKVRGHYTTSEKLGRYFRAMMWLGTAPLTLESEEGEILYDNVQQALLFAFTAGMGGERQTSSAELWANLYLPTSRYVGLSDDIHLYQLNSLRKSVFGEADDPHLINDARYRDRLQEAVRELPAPRIQGKLTAMTTPTGKQFRFMGQRYVMDAYVMQRLMEPIARPVPSGLDVMGVLGSETAERLLLEVYKPQVKWPDYMPEYRKLEERISGYTDEMWGSNLYDGWLWSIREALSAFEADAGVPSFMANEAWQHKALNTALGSYAELKHDTVLYGKQPLAEMGGPVEYAEHHYVEPNVPLYSKLFYLTDYTTAVLDERGMLDESLRGAADTYKELLQLLIDCSVKELRGEALTEDENDRLLWYGGTLEQISQLLLTGMAADESVLELSDMLVSDVATIAPNAVSAGGNLSLGTGFYDHIYVVVPMNGELRLARGSVYSYYEFLSDKRLTDEEWWKLQGLNKVEGEYGTHLELSDPSTSLPKQPAWTAKFKSQRNEIQIEPLEVDWDLLNE